LGYLRAICLHLISRPRAIIFFCSPSIFSSSRFFCPELYFARYTSVGEMVGFLSLRAPVFRGGSFSWGVYDGYKCSPTPPLSGPPPYLTIPLSLPSGVLSGALSWLTPSLLPCLLMLWKRIFFRVYRSRHPTAESQLLPRVVPPCRFFSFLLILERLMFFSSPTNPDIREVP